MRERVGGPEWEDSSYHELCPVISSISDEVGNEASINCLSPELLTSDNARLISFHTSSICAYVCMGTFTVLPEKNCSGGLAGMIPECTCCNGSRSGL